MRTEGFSRIGMVTGGGAGARIGRVIRFSEKILGLEMAGSDLGTLTLRHLQKEFRPRGDVIGLGRGIGRMVGWHIETLEFILL
jgi:hypothetical protein